jgi:hypothetical protein
MSQLKIKFCLVHKAVLDGEWEVWRQKGEPAPNELLLLKAPRERTIARAMARGGQVRFYLQVSLTLSGRKGSIRRFGERLCLKEGREFSSHICDSARGNQE